MKHRISIVFSIAALLGLALVGYSTRTARASEAARSQRFQVAVATSPRAEQAPKQSYIECPVQEVRTEITTPLPQPWWNTPQVGKLQHVGIQTIADKRTLVCEYWAYGGTVGVMREFPEGATNCKAKGKGFSCY